MFTVKEGGGGKRKERKEKERKKKKKNGIRLAAIEYISLDGRRQLLRPIEIDVKREAREGRRRTRERKRESKYTHTYTRTEDEFTPFNYATQVDTMVWRTSRFATFMRPRPRFPWKFNRPFYISRHLINWPCVTI